MKQLPLAIGPTVEPTFDSFLAGPNSVAVEQLHCLSPRRASHPAAFAPLYLWGPPGSGKTHLLRALAGECQAAGQQVGWFDGDDHLPWRLQPEWTLAVIDRCDALSPTAQHAAFALFVDAATHGVQVAAAGRVPPVDLPLRDDLRTRLGWGHVLVLQPLADAQARAVLRREADRRGIFLSDEVMDHVLSRCTRDMGHLMGLLDRLDGFGLAAGRRITLPLVRQMLVEQQQPVPARSATEVSGA